MKMILALSFLFSSWAIARDLKTVAIESFLQSPEVKAAVADAKKLYHRDLEDGAVEAVSVRGVCGVAGCGQTFLVIQNLKSVGVNPAWISVMADVSVSVAGTTSAVRVVRTVNVEDNKKIHCRGSSEYGPRLVVELDSATGEVSRAVLSEVNFGPTRILSEMNVCRTINGPQLLAKCHDVNWSKSYDVELILEPTVGLTAKVYLGPQDRQLFTTLTCK